MLCLRGEQPARTAKKATNTDQGQYWHTVFHESSDTMDATLDEQSKTASQ